MKKTIAKIMAAAMVLSTITVPTANAAPNQAEIVKNFTLTDESGEAHKVIENGVGNDLGTIDVTVESDQLIYDTTDSVPWYSIDTNLVASADIVDVNNTVLDTILGNSAFYATYVDAMRTFVANGTASVVTTEMGTTPGTTPSDTGGSVDVGGETFVIPAKGSKYESGNADGERNALTQNMDGLYNLEEGDNATNKAAAKKAIKAISEAMAPVVAGLTSSSANATLIENLFKINGSSKVGKVVTSGAYLDVNVTAGDGVTVDYATDGSLIVNFPQTTRWATRVENLNNEAIVIPVTVTAGTLNEVVGTFTLKLGGAITVTGDDYWNGFVKLKGDNNRFAPIRVHVDLYDSLNDPKVLINNAIIVQNGNVNLVAVDRFTDWSNNKLTIYDVHPTDMAYLKSDLAKGKNLMLDEVYVWYGDSDFWRSYNTTWWDSLDYWYDLADLTTFATVNLGKVTDIRSRVFKEGKEKLVHAKNVKFIRNGAFRKNKQLKKAILSDDTSMKKINEKAFYDCKKLDTVKVKVKTLKQVGKNAFGGSTDKKSLKFNLKASNKTQYNKAVKLFKKSGVKKAKFRKI